MTPPSAKRILLTGAWGGIGQHALQHMLAAGHTVRCLDLSCARSRRLARRLPQSVQITWGDIRKIDVLAEALNGVEVVIHLAAVLPPLANRNTLLASAVNVVATRNLVRLMARSSTAKRLIFASSMSVAGTAQHQRTPPLLTTEPPEPTDHYGATKVLCENLIRASTLHWTVLRLAACPHARLVRGGRKELQVIFDGSADGRLEAVHVADAGLAFANAVDCEEVIGKVLFVGGGPSCQTNVRHFYSVLFHAMGMNPLPRQAFRPGPPCFYGDWLDTRESQTLLQYQRHSLDEIYTSLRHDVGWKRYLHKALSPLISPLLLMQSPHWRSSAFHPSLP